MNEDIMRACGFGQEVDVVKQGLCPSCKKPISRFRDDLSFKEYNISGLCQKCQDQVFGKPKNVPLEPELNIGPNDWLVDWTLPRNDNQIVFYRYIGKSGKVWIVGDCDDAASHIYVQADTRENVPGYNGFRGFGGSTLRFRLVDNGIVELQGPWHSNSDALYQDTGVDLRHTYVQFVCIAKTREYIGNKCIFRDVLYKEISTGDYYDGTRRAMQLSKELDIPLVIYHETRGGSSNGYVYPDQLDVHGKRPKK